MCQRLAKCSILDWPFTSLEKHKQFVIKQPTVLAVQSYQIVRVDQNSYRVRSVFYYYKNKIKKTHCVAENI